MPGDLDSYVLHPHIAEMEAQQILERNLTNKQATEPECVDIDRLLGDSTNRVDNSLGTPKQQRTRRGKLGSPRVNGRKQSMENKNVITGPRLTRASG